MPSQNGDARFLRLHGVQNLTGLCRSSIYGKMAKGEFPRSLPLGSSRIVAWKSEEVVAWCDAQIAAARPKIAEVAAA